MSNKSARCPIAFKVFYRYHLTQGVALTADIQLLIDPMPGARSGKGKAVGFGLCLMAAI